MRNTKTTAPAIPLEQPQYTPGLRVTASGARRPTAGDLKKLMQRLGTADAWPEAAAAQLIHAAAAADRWLAEHPEQAARLVTDPAGVVEALQRAGQLSQPVDELLGFLKSLAASRGEATSARRSGFVITRSTLRFADKPELTTPAPGPARRRVHCAPAEE